MQLVKQDLEQKLERVETSLLTEFHKWASPNESRQRSYSASLHALELEVDDLKDRMKKLEGHRPPSA